MADNVYSEYLSMLKDVSSVVRENLKDDDLEEQTTCLKRLFKEYDNLLHHRNQCSEAVDRVKQFVLSDDFSSENFDSVELFQQYLNESKSKKVKHPNYDQLVKSCNTSKKDNDVTTTTTTQNEYICPWSLKKIEELAKSVRCGHFFEYSCAIKIAKLSKGKKLVKCPHIGCTQYFTEADIVLVSADDVSD